MSGWRERVLQHFVPEVARLTLAADPDGLLGDERIQQALAERGFELLPYGDDPIAFRFLYESRFRAAWDAGIAVPEPVVVVAGGSTRPRTLPPDLLELGRTVAVGLAELFPRLSVTALSQLDRASLDRLDAAYGAGPATPLGESATYDYLLLHVFAIAPETLVEPHQLLRALLQQHFPGRELPAAIAAHLVRRLRASGRFAGWPLEQIVPSRDAFFAFLQERWPGFVQRWLDQHLGTPPGDPRPVVREPERVRYDGAEALPFDHPDVRVYLDNLFAEGLLEPVEVSHPDRVVRVPELRDSWAALGLRLDEETIRTQRLERLLSRAEEALPAAEALHGAWQRFATLWSEWLFRWHEAGPAADPFVERFAALRDELDWRFEQWMQHRYSALHNVASAAPVMLHHVPRALARELESGRSERVALLVLDGLALDQWALLRRRLVADAALRLEEGTVFSWVPTITPVARQALFSGRAPALFAETIQRTDRDAAGWSAFWAGCDVPASRVRYANAIHQEADLVRVEELASHPQVRALGLVVDVIDRTLHGAVHGSAGLHAQLRHWADTGFLPGVVARLLAHDYTIFLTSDHGNVEGEGIGRPAEGASADVRGERVRIYPTDLLREQVLATFPGTIAWDSAALPPAQRPLLAPARRAFVPAGARVVGHGGGGIEEVIVPFVRISRAVE